MRIGVATAGVAAVIALGQGTAAATPSDPADTAGSSSSGAESAGTASSSATGAGAAQTADTGKSTDPETGQPSAAATATPGAADDADDADELGSAAADPTATAEPTTEDKSEASTEPTAADSEQVAPDGAGQDSEAVQHTGHTPAATPSAATARPTETASADADTTQPAAGTRTVSVAATTSAVAPEVAETVAVRSPEASATSVATLSAAPAAPRVTVKSMVTDVLTWIGLAPLATDLPIPETPVSAMIQSLWLGVRELQYYFNNQRPTAAPTLSGQGLGGTIAGGLNATDYDDATLTYNVVSGPKRGTLTVDAQGNFTYTPNAAVAAGGGTDTFTISVDDNAGNPAHIHGLLGLLGLAGPVTKTITVSVSPAGVAATQGTGPAALNLTDLQARSDLSVGTSAGGTVTNIDGTFTNALVFNAADAAAVLNAAARMLGAPTDFATQDAIVTQAAAATATAAAETFYRLSESVDGLAVLGGDVILVVGENGAVTGLFSHYVTLPDGVDLTADAVVDEEAEARLYASAAYLTETAAAAPDPQTLAGFIAGSTFQDDLVVYALDSDVAPTLAWRVKVIVTKPLGAESDTGVDSGATVYLYANGSKAGQVIVQVANLEAVATTDTVADALGKQRTITYRTTTFFFFFNSYSLIDDVRNITTYQTTYSWFGFGGPSLPGSVVQKGSSGWDTSAISAFANTEAVYDFYKNTLGLTSFDGKGAAVKVSINYNPTALLFTPVYNNAYWDPSIKQFVIGNGGTLGNAEDVLGHEYTHAVVSSILGGSALSTGESGSLNEALADILGNLAEGKTDSGRWLLGEDSTFPGGVVRNLSNPSAVTTAYGAYRTNYANRYTGTGDDGGEHVNSTIFSYAAYKMMTDPATSAVTSAQWSELFYRTIYRLSASAKFVDGRAAVLNAANALGFTAAQQAAMAAAFDSVGITAAATASTIAV